MGRLSRVGLCVRVGASVLDRVVSVITWGASLASAVAVAGLVHLFLS